MPSTLQIAQLKTRLAGLSRHEKGDGRGRFTLGIDCVDAYLDPGPCLFSLHDIHARTHADAVAANAFALALSTRAAQDRPLVWVIQNLVQQEAGALHGSGLYEWGLQPETVVVVQVRDATALLAAGEEALKSGAAGVVLLSSWGDSRAMSLTASRRLAMAARSGSTTAFMVRTAADPCPSAAETRWSIRSALSSGLEAGAPGRPAFTAALTRSRQGAVPAEWTMEWDREARCFREPSPVSGRLVPVPAYGSTAARTQAHGQTGAQGRRGAQGLRRTG